MKRPSAAKPPRPVPSHLRQFTFKAGDQRTKALAVKGGKVSQSAPKGTRK